LLHETKICPEEGGVQEPNYLILQGKSTEKTAYFYAASRRHTRRAILTFSFFYHTMIRILGLVCLLLLGTMEKSFLEEQKRYERVQTAYAEKHAFLDRMLQAHSVRSSTLELYIRIFKRDKSVEVWGRNRGESRFCLLCTYPICALSGVSGPKREAGDGQTPEGFYRITRFNPSSNYYLSLGIDYPNAADRKRNPTADPGGDIFIHGNCVTIGCIPITDDKIKELYVLAVEARNNGQKEIPVHIFPCILSPENFSGLIEDHTDKPELVKFWKNLKEGYDRFEHTRSLSGITVSGDGSYLFR
jgi:murein L,D-transpeptidase YafK